MAQRMQQLGTETAFEVLARARALEAEGRSIVHLEIGEPDFDTADFIREAAKAALDRGETHYVPTAGLRELREAIAASIHSSRGVLVDPRRVLVTPGAKPIMFYTVLATAGPGDEVIYPDPGFPIYSSVVRFAGATAVPLPLRESNGFRVDPDELAALCTSRTRLVILNSPGNPTGAVSTDEELAAIARVAERWDAYVLSDEIYRPIAYEGPAPSFYAQAGMPARTILLDGFSKIYAMTGWRLGFGVFPPELVAGVERLIVNSVSCTAPFVQRGGIAALTGSQAPSVAMVEAFRQRRDFLVQALGEIPGLHCLVPQGAFYAFPRIDRFGTSQEVERGLLQEAGVAVLAGTAFGEAGEGYVRLSYANSLENLHEAVERIRRWCRDR